MITSCNFFEIFQTVVKDLDVLESFGHLEKFADLLESFWTLWEVSEYYGKFQNLWELLCTLESIVWKVSAIWIVFAFSVSALKWYKFGHYIEA